MHRAFPGSLYTLLVSRSRALSTHPPKRGDGGVSPLFEGFVRGGSPSMRPLLTHHKKASFLPVASKSIFMSSYLVWCGLLLWSTVFCARGNWSEPSSVPPVAACWSIKPVCTRPWPSLRPVRPPRALTVDKSWVWPVFDACVGVCRVSEVHGLNVPFARVSPSRSFLPWGLLTEHGSTTAAATTVLRWSSRRPRRSGKWNPSV